MKGSLVKQRGKIRSLVTRLLHRIEKGGYLIKSCLEDDEIVEVKSLIHSLEAKLNLLQQLDVEIDEKDDDGELDTCLNL